MAYTGPEAGSRGGALAESPPRATDLHDEADAELARARALRKGRLVEAAAAAYDAILASRPENAEALSERGLLDYEHGQFAAAAARMECAARLAPGSALIRARYGAVRMAQGRLQEAHDLYRQALALDPERPELLWHDLGNILYQLGEDTEAADAYRHVLRLQPEAPGALNNLANALCNLARRSIDLAVADESIATYRRVLEIDPAFPGIAASLHRALIERARILLLKEDEKRALDACRMAIREAGGRRRATLIRARSQPSAWRPDRPLAVRTLRGVRVLAADTAWCVLTADNSLYLDDMCNANPELGEFVKVSAANGMAILQLDAPRRAVDSCFLLGGSRNYYHWLADYFPRLGLVAVPPSLPLLINRDLAGFQRECLEQIGIAESRLLPVDLPAVIRCTELAAPLAAAYRQRLHPDAVAWLRRIFVAPAQAGAARRLYVSRRDAALRRIVNEEELAAALGALSFETLVPGTMSVKAQAQAFSQAKIIVGPHGAGLVNVIFAPPSAAVIELSAGLRLQPTFMENLAHGLGHRFTRLQCAPLPSPEQRGSVNEQDQDMIVPLPELKRLVGAWAKTAGDP